MAQIASYITTTAVCRGHTAQEIFTSMKRLTPVIIPVTRAANTDEISRSAVKTKVRYSKTHAVVTSTTFARVGLKYLLHVITVKNTILLHTAAIVHVVATVPNYFQEDQNVALQRVVSLHHHVP
jgi:hypothetical protein